MKKYKVISNEKCIKLLEMKRGDLRIFTDFGNDTETIHFYIYDRRDGVPKYLGTRKLVAQATIYFLFCWWFQMLYIYVKYVSGKILN